MSKISDLPTTRTDPSNPCAQESTGINEPNRGANQRGQDEPGMTDRERELRSAAVGSRAPAAKSQPSGT
jgi:hypothetical protein